MLMALLPLAGWAEAVDVTISIKNLSAVYGTLNATACPSLQESDISIIAPTTGAPAKSAIIGCLTVTRQDNGRDAGKYEINIDQTSGTADYNIIVMNSPKLTITRKAIAYTAQFTKEYDGSAMSSFTVSKDADASTYSLSTFEKASWDSWADIALTLAPVGTQTNKVNAGTYSSNVNATISEAAQANYDFTATKGTLTISAYAIDQTDSKVTVEIDGAKSVDYAAAGYDVPNVIVKYNGTTLTAGEDKDYTVAWSPAATAGKFTYAGTYTATVTGKNNFKNTATTTFKINGQSLDGAVITLSQDSYIYDGTAKTPTVSSIRFGSTDLTVSDFDVAYENNKNAGTATVTVTGKNNTTYFNQQATKEFTIEQFDLALASNNVTIDDIADLTYNTKEQKPTPVVKINGTALAASTGSGNNKVTNWTAAYENNTNASTTTTLAKVTVTGTGNYKNSVAKTFTIQQKDISTLDASDFAAYDNQTYSGEQIKPATTGKVRFTHTPASGDDPAESVTLAETTDYTVAYGANNTVAAGGTITYTGTGNYKGTKTVNFNIVKKALTITAKSYTINFGATRPTYEVEYDGLVANDLDENGTPKTGVFTTAPTVKQCTLNTTTEENTTNAGTYALVIFGGSTAHAAVAPNYDINATTGYVDGTLVINANLVTLKVKNKKVPYGTSEPTYTIAASATDGTVASNATDFNNFYELEIVGDASADLATLTSGQVFTFTREKAATKTVGTYNIKVSGATTIAGGYNVTYQDGTLEIEKLKLRAVAQDKTVAWNGGEPTMTAGYNDITSTDNIKFQTYVNNDATKALTDVTLPSVTGVADVAAMGDVVSKIEWVNEAGEAYTSGWTKGHPGTIKVTLKADLSAYEPNYDIAGIDGKVTWTGLDLSTLALDGASAQYAAIQGIDNLQYTTVTVKTGRTGAREIKKQGWNAYILPFKTSVAEISKMTAIGYAVVNVLDAENSSEGNIKFKLWMGDIEANQPFCMKTLNDLPGTTALTFTNKTIVAPAAAKVEVPVGDTGAKFIGCYDEYEITSAAQNENYCFNGGWFTASNSYPVKPFEAYIDRGTSSAPELHITFEEIDGSATAITSIIAEGTSALKADGWYTLSGVKLQAAPTEKGVYVKDGKKVVIK